ncbi:hypothetical protein [Sporosarcina sp. 6E9]|uniref:hypothetical protein n=1 Tax=Sporosarcina sp. 6E9 TaxID=2819235 RepID=UPI001B308A34|nr:hypothetical protein [Sporosarcina sp. 6E9]
MDQKLKTLMLGNVLFHINNFILILLTNTFGLKGIAAIWFFTPFILILFTTSMIESRREKLMGMVDFIVRCIILIINYLALSEFIRIPFAYLIVLGIIFMVLNIYIEWTMHKRLQLSQNEDDDVLTNEEIDDLIEDYVHDKTMLKNKTPAEKDEINESFHAVVYMGYSYVLLALLVGGGIFAFGFWGEQKRWIIFLAAYLLLIIYFYLTERKLGLYYKDNKRRKKISFRDNITFVIGISILYILEGFIYIGTLSFNFFGVFIACAFFIPTLKTNQEIRSGFHKTNKNHING